MRLCMPEASSTSGVESSSINDLINPWTSCAVDEGRPLEIGFQEQVSKHLQAAAAQVCIRETNESEPFEDASLRNHVSSKPEACTSFWDKCAGCLMTEQVVAGVERA